VARGDAELGIQLISEIVSVPGAELLGPLPAELQTINVISAGIVTTASEPDAARTLLKFLSTPAAASVIKAAGMEPGGP
jgi:molybdate transport system substrate-binding protein